MLILKHPWNGIDQEVIEESLEELILKCGQYFDTLEIRNDGWIATGHIPSKGDRLKGKGDSMSEAVLDLYNQITRQN